MCGIKKKILGIIFVLLFAIFSVDPTPVFAVPENNNNTTTQNEETVDSNNRTSENNQDNTEEDVDPETKAATNCADQVGALHWIVCPGSDLLSGFVDGVYEVVIENLVEVKPIATDAKSPMHVVWRYVRDITNSIFIIMILIVIFSHLTGVGINNYHIKHILPRLVLGAIIINLSFILCIIAVDVSNILGSSLNQTFSKVISDAFGNIKGVDVSIGDVVAAIVGGGSLTIGATAIAIAVTSSSWPAVFFILLTLLLGCALSLIAAIVTLATRQALIYLLVMVAPLAIVCYLLPNTETWFKRWRSTFISMLIFYPMFAVLFGACRLAGTVILVSATSPLAVILAIAIKVLPLVLAIPMLRMSGTLPGRVSDFLHNRAVKPVTSTFGAWAREQGALASARRAANISAGRGHLPSHRIQSFLDQQRYERAEGIRSEQGTAADNRSEVLNAKRQGKRVLGRNSDGSLILAQSIAHDEHGNVVRDENGNIVREPTIANNRDFEQEARRRSAAFRASTEAKDLERAMGGLGDHLEQHGINDPALRSIANQNAETFFRSQTIDQAIRRNNKADTRAYMDAVKDANERDHAGQVVNQEAYHRLIRNAAGFDAYSDDTAIREAALTSVVANAYAANDRERRENIENYQAYLTRQNSATIRSFMRNASVSHNDDAVVASVGILNKRGDTDLIQAEVKALFDGQLTDSNGNAVTIDVDSDSSRAIAESLLTVSGDANLKRFGKHLLVEGAVYANEIAALNDPTNTSITSINDVRARQVTFKEYVTGFDANGRITKKGGMAGLLQGTGLTDVERTAMPNIIEAIDRSYYSDDAAGEQAYRERQMAVYDALLPNLIGAVPTYTSGSEQINSAMSYVTGMKFDLKRGAKGEWKMDDENPFTFEQQADFRAMYIENQTPELLVNFKSDAIEAFRSFFGWDDTTSRVDKDKGQAALEIYFQNIFGDNPHDLSRAEIRDAFSRRSINLSEAEIAIFERKLAIGNHTKGQGTITKLLSGDPSALNRMKANIRQLLGIPNNLRSS